MSDAETFKAELTARAAAVKAALRRLGDLPLPLDSQFRLSELYMEFCAAETDLVAATETALVDG